MEHMEENNGAVHAELVASRNKGSRAVMEEKLFEKSLTVSVEIVGDEKITMME